MNTNTNNASGINLPIVYHSIVELPLSQLSDHPLNRAVTGISREHIDTLKALIGQYGYNASNPLTVRCLGSGYQIVEGHHRRIAAAELGYDKLPCVVEDLDDVEANFRLLVSNEQQGNNPLDIGINALDTIEKSNGGRGNVSDLGVRGYARRLGKDHGFIIRAMAAAEVYKLVSHDTSFQADGFFRHLAEIHPAPQWLWPALVQQLLDKQWTVDLTRRAVKALKECREPPEWADTQAVAHALVTGAMRGADVGRFAQLVEKSKDALHAGKEDYERLCDRLDVLLVEKHPSRLSEVQECCQIVEKEQAALLEIRRQEDLFNTKRQEEIAARTQRLRGHVTLEEWGTLQADEQEVLLHLPVADGQGSSFNKQDNTAIEWAQWSWNPVTGCLHNCPYCYARDIAESTKMEKVYPSGFAPSFRPKMLLAPRHMSIPKEAEKDTRYRNVFTCSMADLFGRWVPQEWIDVVFREIQLATAWNFLCLTKFPKRLVECDIPDNAWMGTTVDLQARVKAAEDAFENIHCGVRWLSIEPLLEPLRFQHLDRFDWVVIGGASASSQTPKWVPPIMWVLDVVQQAKDAGCKVYMKTNLGIENRLIELPYDAPIRHDMPQEAQPVFHYLKQA